MLSKCKGIDLLRGTYQRIGWAALRYTVIAADMTVPNADRAITATEKLTGYLLNVKTPSGKSVRFCSVWQVDTGTDVRRFITMYPR